MAPAQPEYGQDSGREGRIRAGRGQGTGSSRVYLHIGEPKTGTTFLQDALWGNQPWLAARGVVLPGYSHRDHSRASRDLREAPRVASDPAEPWAGEWDVLARQALCARRSRSWFWNVHDTLAILEAWSQHIPPDHVHVIIMPRECRAGALWARFASVLGIECAGIDLSGVRANSSLGLPAAEFLRRVNEALPGEMPDWFYTRHVKRILAYDVLGAAPRQARRGLPPGRQAWAAEQAEGLVAGLRDAKYHIVGDLRELLPWPATGRYAGSPGQLPGHLLVDAAVQAAAALADRQYRLMYPVPAARRRLGRPRQIAGRLARTALNGPRARRALRSASHIRLVRHLRVVIWRALIRPARYP